MQEKALSPVSLSIVESSVLFIFFEFAKISDPSADQPVRTNLTSYSLKNVNIQEIGYLRHEFVN